MKVCIWFSQTPLFFTCNLLFILWPSSLRKVASSLLLLRSFSTVTHSSPAWSLSRSKKESDTSSIEDTGQAYVVGKDFDL